MTSDDTMTSEVAALDAVASDGVRRAAAETARQLSAQLGPDRVLTGGPDLAAAAAVWNGAVTHGPAMVVRPTDTAEVALVVRAARAHGLPLSVRGAGHDWAGRAVRPGALVIDLTLMREVVVRGTVATVQGGATLEDVARAADGHGLAAVTGTVGTVGMAGLALGGGYGPLSGRFGIAADSIVGAEVVLADGDVVSTDDDHDLLWALHGGGGNFGVVTALRVRLHPVTTLVAATFLFGWAQAAQVLAGYAEPALHGPDGVTTTLTVVTGMDGAPAVVVAPVWSGEGDGAEALERFARLGTPLHREVATLSPRQLLARNDGAFPDGAHYAVRTRSLPGLDLDAVGAVIEAGATRPGPGAFLNVHSFHGAAARVPVESTAFGTRTEHLMVEVIATWESGPGGVYREWTRATDALLAPHALPGGYPNLLGPDDHAQIAHAYGPNTARLLDAKARLDPTGVFTATPLPGPAPDGSRPVAFGHEVERRVARMVAGNRGHGVAGHDSGVASGNVG